MNIFNKKFDFPKNHNSDIVTIFPTNIEFAASDFEAVMASKEELRLWSVSDWPEDDFTITANREDLKYHVEDNLEYTAYGFMLYDPSKKTCYGSLYINPIHFESFKNEKEEIEKFDVRINCWIRTDIEESFKIDIIKTIINWLNRAWPIRWGFSARPTLPQYQNLFIKSGLKRSLTLVYKESNKLHLYTL